MVDPEYSSLYADRDLHMLPAGTDSAGACPTYGFETPDSSFSCEIYAKDINLIYSPPESSIERDMCAQTPLLTITDYGSLDHVSQSALDGTILYKDRVYIFAENIHAWTSVWSVQTDADSRPILNIANQTQWDCVRQPLGTTISRTIIELRSHEVSSLRAPYTDRFYPFNYAVSSRLSQESSTRMLTAEIGSDRACPT